MTDTDAARMRDSLRVVGLRPFVDFSLTEARHRAQAAQRAGDQGLAAALRQLADAIEWGHAYPSDMVLDQLRQAVGLYALGQAGKGSICLNRVVDSDA